ncbi:MAG TPA: type II toxin-antitoxin system PemK/MazF family toxin [Candidatus Faecisoma merdavium]|nr:type II toxin-antitoxin system PemK/MazF family toxin [Candidatus Faecisoma merdavium]
MNIIELARKNNLIKELKDIDIVEDNSIYLNEENSSYNFKYNVGDIVFVKKYNYSNGTKGSNHLFLIIEDNYIVSMDYFCLLISSQLDKLKYETNLFLAKDCKNNLKKDSILKLDNIYRIENNDILFKVGEVTQEKLNVYRDIFIKMYS